MESGSLEFDGWTVDRVSGEISRAGRIARLPQQPLRILIELFDHSGAVVTREQLVKVLWPAGVVDFDNGLNVAMRKLRVALDDVGDTPRYIETLPRVGYRFIGRPVTVTVLGSDCGRAPLRSRPRARTALLIALAALMAGLGVRGGCGPAAIPRGTSPANVRRSFTSKVCSCARAATSTPVTSRSKSSQAALREDPEYAEAWAAYGQGISVAVIRQKQTPAEGCQRHALPPSDPSRSIQLLPTVTPCWARSTWTTTRISLRPNANSTAR
jgi:DNA-binding winged helix-turn-helix (wHTH) protein